ncbi:hypothetical protein GQ457_14G004970 [Hibiscus cannabinus]
MCANEYYLNLHVGGKFVRDPHLRYVNGTKVRIKEDPVTISYFELCKIVQEDLSFSLEIIEGTTQGVGQMAVEGFDKGIEEVDHEIVEEGNEGDDEGNDGDDVYFVKVRYLSDGDDDDELQAELEEERGKGTVVECGHEMENYDSDDHGHITESFLDDEDEYCARMRGIFSMYNPNDENQEFCIRMLFKDGKEFKDAIRKYSKLSRRELKIVRNEPKRIRVKCIASAKCPWRIFVKSFQEEHNCCVSFQNKMVNVAAIADHFEATIRDHPKMKLKEIQRRVASEMHVNVNITRCKRAKKRVNEKLSGNFKEEFAMLWDYADELRLKNPGPFKGELLSAIGRDANNQMYPVAWAVVELECTDSWAWFLNLLATDLDLNDGFGFTIISDQQKGLEIAIKDILPRIEHRNCARHVFANWIGRKKAKSYEFDFWEIVKATTEREWEDKIEALTKKMS